MYRTSRIIYVFLFFFSCNKYFCYFYNKTSKYVKPHERGYYLGIRLRKFHYIFHFYFKLNKTLKHKELFRKKKEFEIKAISKLKFLQINYL